MSSYKKYAQHVRVISTSPITTVQLIREIISEIEKAQDIKQNFISISTRALIYDCKLPTFKRCIPILKSKGYKVEEKPCHI